MSTPYSILDLFCGTGALSYGLEKYSSSFSTVGGIDLNASASRTASLNHPTAKIICAPIESVDPSVLLSQTGASTVDLIVGGPPCQGFSSLRPSRGEELEDPRNGLYRQFLRFVKALRPRAFLMENVVGILSAKNGNLVDRIVREFECAGYRCDWRVLNAANFGVPQKRERFFLLGVRSNLGQKVMPDFPVPTHKFVGRVIGTARKDRYVRNTESGVPAVTVWDAISDLPPLGAGEKKERYAAPPKNDFQAARRAGAGKLLELHEATAHDEKMLEIIRHSGSSIYSLPPGLVTSGYSSCYSRLAPDEPATTVTVKFTSPASSKCIHPWDDRSITPREAARLQSFDDAFKFFGGRTDVASQIGNAVPPLFGQAFAPILERLLDSQSIGEY